MARSSLIRLAAVCLISSCLLSTTAASAPRYSADLTNLIARDDLNCENTTFTKCGGSFPGNFCCGQGSKCQSMNDGKSAICCPEGRDCALIGPISCDVQQQNATSHPLSQLFTTDLTTPLPKCGDLCCPAGMSCSNGDQCKLESSSSTSSAPSSSAKPSASASSSAAKTTSSGSSPTQSVVSASESSTNNGAVVKSHCSKFPTAGVLVGFFCGLAAGIITTILCICCIGRSRSHDSSKRDSGDLSSIQASVSDPIYNSDASNSYRTDFLRRASGPSSPTRHNHRASRASTKMKSMFRTPTTRSKASPSVRSMPKTPSMKKEPSMESIRIYSPPNIDRATQNTTFAEMMREVGLKEHEPYLGSPGRVDPRSRRLGEV